MPCLVGYSPWGCKQSDTTERLNNKKYVLNTILDSENTSVSKMMSSYIQEMEIENTC